MSGDRALDERQRLAGEALRRVGADARNWPNSAESVIAIGVLIERIEALESAIISTGHPLRFREGGLTDPKWAIDEEVTA